VYRGVRRAELAVGGGVTIWGVVFISAIWLAIGLFIAWFYGGPRRLQLERAGLRRADNALQDVARLLHGETPLSTERRVDWTRERLRQYFRDEHERAGEYKPIRLRFKEGA
jgi:hypothetical protein